MKHHELPRVLRRTIGLMRFARETVRANSTSLFLLDTAGQTLHGLVSEWDWTRTSFGAELSDWPTAARALAGGGLQVLSRSEAIGAEAAWFEPRGISSTVCVPLRTVSGPLGVLFFDFDGAVRLSDGERALLVDVGERTGRALARPCRKGSSRRWHSDLLLSHGLIRVEAAAAATGEKA